MDTNEKANEVADELEQSTNPAVREFVASWRATRNELEAIIAEGSDPEAPPRPREPIVSPDGFTKVFWDPAEAQKEAARLRDVIARDIAKEDALAKLKRNKKDKN